MLPERALSGGVRGGLGSGLDSQRGGSDAASPAGAPEWPGFGGIGYLEHGSEGMDRQSRIKGKNEIFSLRFAVWSDELFELDTQKKFLAIPEISFMIHANPTR
jgi:hypothetical protein